MSDLLDRVLDAHGGLERWREFSAVRATIVTGGGSSSSKDYRRTRPAGGPLRDRLMVLIDLSDIHYT